MMDYMRECHWFRVAHNVGDQLLFVPKCGITKASCSTDKCPADFGEWGAWRAVIATAIDDSWFDPACVRCMNAFDMCRGEYCRDCHANPDATGPRDRTVREMFDAVGWSP